MIIGVLNVSFQFFKNSLTMTYPTITDISKIDENFLKEFSRDFYQKIIDTDDFNIFEITLREWIKGINTNATKILELMQNHKENEFLFSSIIGFFYQHGI